MPGPRRTYVWDPVAKAVVEVAPDWQETPRGGGWGSLRSEAETYDGVRALDGADISSRRKRREYMKATGTTDPSDYQQGYWSRATEAKRRHLAGEVDTSGGRRKESLARLLYGVK